MPDADQDSWPLDQRDHPAGALVDEISTFRMQVQDDEGRWMGPFGGVKSDRAEMTRVQAFRAQAPETAREKRRIIRHVLQIWVDEVEGDGEGETSLEELLARNEENTARLIAEKAAEQTRTP